MNHTEPITAKCCQQWHSLFFNIFTNLISPVSKIAAAVCSDLAAVVGLAVRQPELLLLISSSVEQNCGGKTVAQCLGAALAGRGGGKNIKGIYRFCLSGKKMMEIFMEEFSVTHFFKQKSLEDTKQYPADHTCWPMVQIKLWWFAVLRKTEWE